MLLWNYFLQSCTYWLHTTRYYPCWYLHSNNILGFNHVGRLSVLNIHTVVLMLMTFACMWLRIWNFSIINLSPFFNQVILELLMSWQMILNSFQTYPPSQSMDMILIDFPNPCSWSFLFKYLKIVKGTIKFQWNCVVIDHKGHEINLTRKGFH